jgi:hypothetical protein
MTRDCDVCRPTISRQAHSRVYALTIVEHRFVFKEDRVLDRHRRDEYHSGQYRLPSVSDR